MYFNENDIISSLNSKPLILLDLSSYILSTKNNVNIGKAWIAWDRLTTKWKFDKIKQEVFQAVAISVLLNGCTSLTLMKYLEKNLDRNYTRKSLKQHPIKKQLYSHLLPISQNILVSNMLGTARNIKTDSWMKFSNRLLFMDMPVLTDLQKLSFISSVKTLDAV